MSQSPSIQRNVAVKIFPRQRDFIFAPDDEVFYGGSAGGGKSHALLIFAALRRQKYPRTTGILFRRTYPELERSLILKSHELFPQFGAKYQEQKHRWRFPNGSLQEFGFCERDKDVYKYQGAEYHDQGFDELTLFTEFQFNYLTSRCRSALPGVRPLIRGASNPGNVGHVWVKTRYIEPSKISKRWKDPVAPERTVTFVPATFYDNPALKQADPHYLDRLKHLGEKKYRALALGDWDIFEGQYFTEWDGRPGQSVLAHNHEPSHGTIKFLSLDWGYSEPAAVYWWEVTPMGRVFIYRELYCTNRSPKELAADILTLSPRLEKYSHIVLPPEIFGKRIETEGGGQPIAELMQQVFKDRIPVKKANNARIPGWIKTREFLSRAPDGKPWLQISPNCVNLIRTLPAMIHDEDHPEDLDNDGEDHAVDAVRYGAVDLHEIPKTLLTPHTGLHEIFANRKMANGIMSHLPTPKGRSGYGR
jgi:phage terminase large subunit